jgi:pilus assembly protein CpaB
MKPKSIMLFVVAAGCGLVAMIGVQQMMSSKGKQTPRARVLVARAEIEPGVRLTEDLVGFREIPIDAIPEGAVTNADEYNERALRVRAFPGQVIQIAQLGEKGQFGTSLDIPAGMRLVTVPVNATMIHSGIMKPGDRVDLVLTYEVMRRGAGRQFLTKTILQYIQVYALGDVRLGSEVLDSKAPVKDVKNVSLLVSQKQAELVKFAERLGTLHLTLRGVLDKEAVSTEVTDAETLQSLKADISDAEPKPESREATVEAPPAPVDEEVKQPSFAEFVQAEPPTPVVVAAAPKPVWKMEIYEGQEKKTYELELPSPPVEENTSASAGDNQGVWNSPLLNWLGGQRREKPATTTTMKP